MNIRDSRVLVTGANRGMGKAFADALLDRGAAKVYAAVRDVATVTDPRLVPVQLNVTDPDRIAAVARELDDVQLVVNNAGVLHVGVPLSASLDAAGRARDERPRPGLDDAGVRAGAGTQRRGRIYQRPVCLLVGRDTAAHDPLGIQGRRMGLHERGTDRAAAPRHPCGRRPRSTRWSPMSQRLSTRAIRARLSDGQGAFYPQIEREFLAMTGAGTTAT
jgi:hypothetical protein